ncbi:MAG: HAD family hydrolase [Bacilli bacterium]|nr:HAD family hydrolase [Bacilli bacterium]
MAIKCLIFDLDDTLVDDTENHRGAYKHITKVLNKPFTEVDFQKWFEFDSYYWHDYFKSLIIPDEYKNNGDTASDYLRGMRFTTYFKEELPYDPIEMQEFFKEGLTHRIIALPHAVEAIRDLSSHYPIFISTNGDSTIAKEKTTRIGIEEYIKGIFSADMTNPPASKSDLDYYRQLMAFIKDFQIDECLMTGDKYRDDVLMPNKAGMKTCWLHKGKEENLVCDYQVENLKELKKILLKREH